MTPLCFRALSPPVGARHSKAQVCGVVPWRSRYVIVTGERSEGRESSARAEVLYGAINRTVSGAVNP
jgi:hypothetical protein